MLVLLARRPGCAVAAGRVVGAPAVVGTGDPCRVGAALVVVPSAWVAAEAVQSGNRWAVRGRCWVHRNGPARDASVGVAGWGSG